MAFATAKGGLIGGIGGAIIGGVVSKVVDSGSEWQSSALGAGVAHAAIGIRVFKEEAVQKFNQSLPGLGSAFIVLKPAVFEVAEEAWLPIDPSGKTDDTASTQIGIRLLSPDRQFFEAKYAAVLESLKHSPTCVCLCI